MSSGSLWLKKPSILKHYQAISGHILEAQKQTASAQLPLPLSPHLVVYTSKQYLSDTLRSHR